MTTFPGRPQVPLTYGQHLLTFLETLHPGGAFGPRFSMMETYELRGPLDLAAFEWALGQLIARHDALRSVLVNDGQGVPYQEIRPECPVRLAVVDLPPPADRDRVQVVEDFVNRVQSEPHPTEPPLVWAWLGRFGPDDHVLVLVLHRSVSDAWSMEIALRDLSACYASRLTGGDPDLPPIAMQYSDFALAEQEENDPRLAEALDYWESKLAGPEVLLHPTDRPRPRTPSERKAHLLLPIDRELRDEVVDFSRTSRVTVFMTLLAAFSGYLRRATGTDDISVPTQTAGRTRPEVEDTIGFFLNALILRTDLGGDPTLAELLTRVRKTCLEAFRHEVPILLLMDRLPLLAAALADDRHVLMPFQHVHIPKLARTKRLGGECFYTPFVRDPARAVLGIALPMDALFTVRWVGEAMLVSVNYSTDLFDESTIEQMAVEFVGILREVVRRPGARLSQLALA